MCLLVILGILIGVCFGITKCKRKSNFILSPTDNLNDLESVKTPNSNVSPKFTQKPTSKSPKTWKNINLDRSIKS